MTTEERRIGLSDLHREMLREILAPFADRIERVSLFGSRATGRARANSDIDLVLYGDIDDALMDRIWSLCDESALPVRVDLCAYDRIIEPALEAHIDAVASPLFERHDLLRSASSMPVPR
ncbi:MAG: nucleotidyltransferase domain-containing protein [Geminicoccaceae bacterium]|nr:nucleotidyltransferase domain-containing protein [Geminicoccaceae bacterium]